MEHSTPIDHSLLKFSDLQDFYAEFFIVAAETRRREYEDKIAMSAFIPIQKRTKFLDYERLSDWHTKTSEIINLERTINSYNS